MDTTSPITTWQHVFENNAISTTRTIEKQLRATIGRDREKLRSLAGGNYRELLSTADQIVQLDDRTKFTELCISELSQDCKPPGLDRAQSDSGHQSLRERASQLAQLRFLHRCCTCVEVGRRSSSLLLCGQLIALSRLFFKSLEESKPLAKALDLLKRRLTSLRRQLLRDIDRIVVNPDDKIPKHVEALTSYCLVTNSTAPDAVKHFQRRRLESLSALCNAEGMNASRVTEGLQCIIATLQTSKILLGRPLNEALSSLQKQPILDNPLLQQLEPLHLDQTVTLLPDDIRTFTPYFKRTTLSASDIQHLQETWSQEASEVLNSSLRTAISAENDLTRLLHIRRDLYSTLLPVYFSTEGHVQLDQNLRSTLDSRIREICHTQISRLAKITDDLLRDQPITSTTKPLWEQELVRSPPENGANKYLRQIHRYHTGADVPLSKSLRMLQKWITHVNHMRTQILDQRTIRWRDMIEEPDEENEDDDDDIVRQLSQTDLNGYIKNIDTSIRDTLARFETSIHAASVDAVKDESSSAAARAVHLVRVIRETAIPLQRSFPEDTQFDQLSQSVPILHDRIAQEIVNLVSTEMEKFSRSRQTSIDPADNDLAQSLPSPRAVMTLRTLCRILVQVGGTDLWSSAAIRVVKEEIYRRITDPAREKYYARTAFDKVYLETALRDAGSSAKKSENAVSKAASDYWSRTRLLFGQLA